MKIEKMFEVAIRSKFRFNFRGSISTEDLWDLSVTDLDSIFKVLNSQVKQVKEESLLGSKTKQDKELELKIDIIKYIVATKLEEQELRSKARETKEYEQKLLTIMADKQDEELKNKSVDEIKKMLDDLQK